MTRLTPFGQSVARVDISHSWRRGSRRPLCSAGLQTGCRVGFQPTLRSSISVRPQQIARPYSRLTALYPASFPVFLRRVFAYIKGGGKLYHIVNTAWQDIHPYPLPALIYKQARKLSASL